jgi:hypothetical protein
LALLRVSFFVRSVGTGGLRGILWRLLGPSGGVDYALFKFRRPIEHVSVDLDVLVGGGCVGRAVRALKSIGFEVVVSEPYTITLSRRGFTVDLYT